jgi:hypothetical protein
MGLFLLLLLALQAPPTCTDAPGCRAEAEAAAARGEFEAFHDLAWRAMQKGRPNDPSLMLLLARAQALSGRPEDALVMLGRLVDLHAPVDLSLPDFEHVRARPGWPALESRVTGIAPAPSAAGAAAPPAPDAPRAADAPPPGDALEFDAPADLGPFAIVHDAVSRRFVVGDAHAPRLLIVDEVSRHVVPYVSASSAGFYDELTGLAVDDRRGDLWVASATGSGPSAATMVHKLQLVSGRGLMEARLPESALPARFVDVAVTPDGTVLALDALGPRLFRLRPGAKTFELAQRLEVRGATALAAVDDRVVFVAGDWGVARIDLASRAVQRVTGVDDLGGFVSLAWRNGALVGVQRAKETWLVARVALDAAGTRAQPRGILAASPSALVGTLARGSFYYLSNRAIRRVAVR